MHASFIQELHEMSAGVGWLGFLSTDTYLFSGGRLNASMARVSAGNPECTYCKYGERGGGVQVWGAGKVIGYIEALPPFWHFSKFLKTVRFRDEKLALEVRSAAPTLGVE